MPWIDADACFAAVGEHGGQVVGLALDAAPPVQLVDEHVGLVVGPGWERGARVREKELGVRVVHFDVHGVIFEDIGLPVEDAVAGVEVVVGVTLVLGGGGEGEGRGGGEDGEEST